MAVERMYGVYAHASRVEVSGDQTSVSAQLMSHGWVQNEGPGSCMTQLPIGSNGESLAKP